MNFYAAGGGPEQLANLLDISNTYDLSSPGSCNDRIIRTTARHSYQTSQPTFYLLGMTFLNRTEMPILHDVTADGHWVSFQNQAIQKNWAWPWTDKDTEQFVELYLKSQFANMKDRAEDLMYKLSSLITSLHSRGHRCLIFQQAEDRYQDFLQELTLFSSTPVFIKEFAWRAIPWQLEQGAQPVQEDLDNTNIPRDMMHIAPKQHKWLNNFLFEYIKEFKILE
jgi:hypothetical protein